MHGSGEWCVRPAEHVLLLQLSNRGVLRLADAHPCAMHDALILPLILLSTSSSATVVSAKVRVKVREC
jgi:hypothetical protein